MSSIMRWRSGDGDADEGFMILLLLKSEAGCLAAQRWQERWIELQPVSPERLPRERFSPPTLSGLGERTSARAIPAIRDSVSHERWRYEQVMRAIALAPYPLLRELRQLQIQFCCKAPVFIRS